MPEFLKDNSWMLALAAFGTAIAAFREQLKSIISVLKSMMIINITLDEYMSCLILSEYLRTKAKVYGLKNYNFNVIYVPEENGSKIKVYSNLKGNSLAFLGRIPLFISAEERKSDPSGMSTTINLSFVRGTIKVDKLLKDLEDFGNEMASRSRFKIIREYGDNRSSQPPRDTSMPYVDMTHFKTPMFTDIGSVYTERLSLTSDTFHAMAEAEKWFGSKQWFKQRLIPWKRGWLLVGPPGTGKSSLARAVAQKMDVPLILMDIASMNNSDFIRAWKQLTHSVPCVVLIEDLDASFHGRTNVTKGEFNDKLTFDCLINTIDGVQSMDGVFLIITTNDISKIDPALASDSVMSSRPGRIDRVITMNGLDKAGYEKMAARILGKQVIPDDLIENALKSNTSPAQFQEICIRKALTEFYQ